MATDARTRLLSAEEFMDLDLGEGMHELVRGEIIEMPPPEIEHGYVCSNLAILLGTFGKRTGHGNAVSNDSVVVTHRDPDTVRGGDILYYSNARLPRARFTRGLPPVPPDLVVEVRSPSDRPGAIRQKVMEYLDAGVSMIWVADPSTRTLTIHRPEAEPIVLGDTETIDGLPELPGFACAVAELFD